MRLRSISGSEKTKIGKAVSKALQWTQNYRSLQSAHALTGYDGQEPGKQWRALRELSRVTEYDEQLESLSQTLSEVDGLLNDFNRELSPIWMT